MVTFVCNIYADVNRLPSFLMSASLDRNKEPLQKEDCRLLPFAKRNVSRRQSTKIQRYIRRLHLGKEWTFQRRSKNIIILRTDYSPACDLLILQPALKLPRSSNAYSRYVYSFSCVPSRFCSCTCWSNNDQNSIWNTYSFSPLSLSFSISFAFPPCSSSMQLDRWDGMNQRTMRLQQTPGTNRTGHFTTRATSKRLQGSRESAARMQCEPRVGCKTRPTAWKDDGARDKTRRDASLFTVYAGLHMQSETVRWFRIRRFKSSRRKCTGTGMKCIIWHVSLGIKARVFAELSVLNAAVDDEHVKLALNEVFSRSATLSQNRQHMR